MTSPLLIAPSILSADPGKLTSEILDVEQAGADWIHIDVMDGVFVPAITFGPIILDAIRPHTKLPLDVHLMIVNPDPYIDQFAEKGADIISVHAETCTHLHRTLNKIRSCGKRAGVVLNPHTPESVLEYVYEEVDLILVMSVNPGFGGQKFIPSSLKKLEAIRKNIDRLGLQIDLQIDGGVGPGNIKQIASAGANAFVAGSSVFAQPNRKEAIQALRTAAR